MYSVNYILYFIHFVIFVSSTRVPSRFKTHKTLVCCISESITLIIFLLNQNLDQQNWNIVFLRGLEESLRILFFTFSIKIFKGGRALASKTGISASGVLIKSLPYCGVMLNYLEYYFWGLASFCFISLLFASQDL